MLPVYNVVGRVSLYWDPFPKYLLMLRLYIATRNKETTPNCTPYRGDVERTQALANWFPFSTDSNEENVAARDCYQETGTLHLGM